MTPFSEYGFRFFIIAGPTSYTKAKSVSRKEDMAKRWVTRGSPFARQYPSIIHSSSLPSLAIGSLSMFGDIFFSLGLKLELSLLM
ncbi:hypothetical protein TYRP_022123 [Tyrophagus putrescentiae]|nr:hypothetical protein TYRP_022123 [Tyrophagus putrescentiae]